jgi:hypothetical protein
MKRSTRHSRTTNDARAQRVVDHVLRHRISTNGAIRRHVCTDLSPNSVSKLTAGLCRKGLLARHPLFPPAVYFTLGETAARDRGVRLHRAQPLGPQALPMEYGVLAYAALGTVYHRRLTSDELEQLLPGAPASLLSETPYCLDESQRTSVLELLRVDLGGRADHVARKTAAEIRHRKAEPAFGPWLRQGRLRLVIVTGAAEKAAAIRAAVDQHLWPDGLSIHLAVVPQLLRLTGRI